MRTKLKRYFSIWNGGIGWMLVLLCSGCIAEDRSDCRMVVRFDYSYNLLDLNAFGQEAEKLRLYVFDQEGVLVKMYMDQGTHLTQEGYRLDIQDLPPGDYQYVGWARSMRYEETEASFALPDLTPGVSNLSDLNATLPTQGGVRTGVMNNLLVGHVPVRYTNFGGENTVVIPTKKANKEIRVILIDKGTGELNEEDYRFHIEDEQGNASINYDFRVLDHERVVYKPYFYKKTTPETREVVSVSDLNRALVGQLAVSRLVEDHQVRLVIENQSGQEVINEDLLYLISLAEHEGTASRWGFQEYLDRQDHYAITIYINGDTSTWIETTLVVNGWVINNNGIEG